VLQTLTRCPQLYVSGAAAMRGHALDECDFNAIDRDASWNNALNGGPIDATDYLPTGRLTVSRGFVFFELVDREG
jgi:hypothetical protein